MAVLAAIAFATLLLEDDNFFTFHEGTFYLANYFCPFYGRSADLNGTVLVNEEHAVKLDRLAFLDILAQEVNIQELVLFCLELLSLNLYDYVHLLMIILQVNPSGGASATRFHMPGAEI